MHYLARLLLVAFLFFPLYAWSAVPVDVNHADADTLAQVMKGVGPNKAAAIVAYRTLNGPFRSIEELVRVKGIGKKTVERNRSLVFVGRY